MRNITTVGLLFSLLSGFILGCSNGHNNSSTEYNPASKPEVKADAKIDKSFSIVKVDKPQTASGNKSPAATTGNKSSTAPEREAVARPELPLRDLRPSQDKAKIRISKSALEKEFLWHAEMISQLTAPSFNGLKSRVVAFRLRGNTLYLLEATQGHTVTTDMPQTLILASFPVTHQDDENVEFDFNKGMSDIFVAADWRASDFEGPYYQGESDFISVPVRHSYIEDATVNSKNQLVIKQHALITTAPLGMGHANSPVEARYYFSPYEPNPNYKPIDTVDFDRMGFFEVAPQLAEGSLTKIFATRFDPAPAKTITYAISANTPDAYKIAVRDGILYWNRVFGYEKIKVIEAPAGVSAPDSEYNIVQWVPYDAAGGAYADAQMDPRTGEIHHAQVFMTSAFAFTSKSRALALYRQFGLKPAGRPAVSLAGFAHSTLCNRENTEHLHSLLDEVLTTNLTDDKILEISRDYVREVVAHEVGHTLGLRHNFAGNMSANFDMSELNDIFKKYLTNLEVKTGLQASSSVMEYQNFPSAVMTGRQMATSVTPAYTYDAKAIGVLYNEAPLVASETPLYCTDTHRGAYVGCAIWDQGNSPLADAAYNEKMAIDNFAKALIESIILSKTTPFGNSTGIEKLQLDPVMRANSLLANRSLYIQVLTDSVKDLKIYRSFTKVDGLNKALIAEKMLAATAAEINRLGGLNKLLAMPSASLAANWTESFNTLIESEFYKSGIGYNGQPYTFSSEEITQAKLLAADYFTKVQAAMALADVTVLSKHNGNLLDNPLSDAYAELLAARANEYLTNESGQLIEGSVTLDDNKSAILRLPVFKYEHPIRLAAANLFVSRKATAIDWGLYQHVVMKDQFKTKVKSILMENDIAKIPAARNPRPVARWLLENSAVISALNAR